MARLTQKNKGPRKKGKSKAPSRNALTPQDLVVTLLFIGSIAFALASFSNAVKPMDDTFVLWPMAIGAVAGAVLAVIAHRFKPFETVGFVIGVMAFSGAALGIGAVLALNRPLDRSPVKHHMVSVVHKYQIGDGEHATYHLELAGFPLNRLDVEEEIFSGTRDGGTVDLLTREGFFGYRYLERVQLVKLELRDTQNLPDVPPAIPVDDLPGGKK